MDPKQRFLSRIKRYNELLCLFYFQISYKCVHIFILVASNRVGVAK